MCLTNPILNNYKRSFEFHSNMKIRIQCECEWILCTVYGVLYLCVCIQCTSVDEWSRFLTCNQSKPIFVSISKDNELRKLNFQPIFQSVQWRIQSSRGHASRWIQILSALCPLVTISYFIILFFHIFLFR